HLPTQHPVLRALAGDEDVQAALGGPSYVPQPTAAEETDEDDVHGQPTVPITDEPLSSSIPGSAARDTSEPETDADDTAATEAPDKWPADATAADAESETPADTDTKTQAPADDVKNEAPAEAGERTEVSAETDEKTQTPVAADSTAAADA